MPNVHRMVQDFLKNVSAPAASNSLLMQRDYELMNLEVTGNAASFSLQVEGQVVSEDTFHQMASVNLKSITLQEAITEPGVYQVELSGWKRVRVNLTAVADGTVSVSAKVVG